jgi:hypothetical protein
MPVAVFTLRGNHTPRERIAGNQQLADTAESGKLAEFGEPMMSTINKGTVAKRDALKALLGYFASGARMLEGGRELRDVTSECIAGLERRIAIIEKAIAAHRVR